MRKGRITSLIVLVVALLLAGAVALQPRATTSASSTASPSERAEDPGEMAGEGGDLEREAEEHVGAPVTAAGAKPHHARRSPCDGSARAGSRMGR